ncbi:HAD family hydrolase [Kribbella solani]|uniref:Putative hydrolase of the HAD superfamily n=1 Tax=Kribbella solani TaxID=236067 RepID=A0A841E146_9ACTN|nr:HAD-IA family hydrolase [Kribbella solani]MBB5982756.1 putative hydrolase of the HAD superfamily [Kribbella solani]MDX2969800.1 HAD family hydrolase [Kribbella solani]
MKGVVFDLDDTLFDHSGCAEVGLRGWVADLGRTATDELVARWFVIEQDCFDRFLAGELTHVGQRRCRLRAFLPLLGVEVPATDAGLDAVFEGYLARYRQSWAAYPDARAALEVARGNGWRVGVLTNGSTVQQNAKLRAIGLADLIDVVCVSEQLGVSKPAPEAYLRTCQALGVLPAETLMIGDNLELDVIGAQAAGLSARHLDRRSGGTLLELI